MNIVIDITAKVNSELACGHIRDISPVREAVIHLTDDAKLAYELSKNGKMVVPIYMEDNDDFDYSSYQYLIIDPDEVDEDYYLKIWLRLNNLPWHILDTERLSIREMTEQDVSALYELYEEPVMTKYTEALFPEYEDEVTYTRNYIANVYSYFGFGTWIVERKCDRKIIGRAGFNYREGLDNPELGYLIGLPYQRQGYAYEACHAIMNYLKDEYQISSINAFSHPDNLASIRLLDKLGFVKTVSTDLVPNLDRYIFD